LKININLTIYIKFISSGINLPPRSPITSISLPLLYRQKKNSGHSAWLKRDFINSENNKSFKERTPQRVGCYLFCFLVAQQPATHQKNRVCASSQAVY
jgi:hypothetical protein